MAGRRIRAGNKSLWLEGNKCILYDNGEVSIYSVFGKDCSDVQLMGIDFCFVPKGRTAKLCIICNALNQHFRWTKFYVKDENKLIVEEDAVIQLDSCAEECMELVMRMAGICDDAIPIINKAIWSE